MAITHVNTTQANQATAASDLTISAPASLQDNDILFGFLAHADDVPAVSVDTVPTGFTLEGADGRGANGAVSPPRMWVYWKRLTDAASEPSSYTWGWDQVGGKGGGIVCLRGCIATGNPFGQDAQGTNSGTGTSINMPDITTVNDGEWVFRIGIADDDDGGIDSFGAGVTQRINQFNATGGNGFQIGVADEVQATAGSPGTHTFTIATEERDGWTISILPAPEGGVYEQDSFRGRNDDGSESAATWKAAANTNWSNLINENLRLRFLIEETDDVAEDDVEFQLQYNRNAGGWNNVTGASSVAQASASPNVADAANTTEQLSGPGTFITTNAGFDEVNGIAGGTALDFTVTVNQEVEVEYCIQIQGADVDDADTIQFRVAKGGAALNAYTNTPTVTVQHANYDQASFRAKNDTGGITSTDWKAALNTNWNQSVDENVRVRFLIQETRDVADANRVFQLQYNHNGAGWNNVTGSSLVARATASPNVVDGVDTTQQLGAGTFLTSNDGFDEVDGAVGGAALDFTSTANQEVELEFCVQIRSADVAQNDSVQLRVIATGGGGAVNTYTNIPLLTARIPQAFVMSNSANLTDGEATTQQLTAGSGTFVAGRVEESTAQSAAEVEVSASNYTEYEFCIQRTSQSSPSTQYQFRIADERAIGELLNDYAVDPRVTTSA